MRQGAEGPEVTHLAAMVTGAATDKQTNKQTSRDASRRDGGGEVDAEGPRGSELSHRMGEAICVGGEGGRV